MLLMKIRTVTKGMSDIPYLCIHVIYMSPPCALGLALHTLLIFKWQWWW